MEEQSRIDLSFYDTYLDETVNISRDAGDMVIEEDVKLIRRFLMAIGYTEEQIGRFIIDPHGDYSLFDMEEKMMAKAVLSLPSTISENNDCEQKFDLFSPKRGEKYWYLDSYETGGICLETWEDMNMDELCLKNFGCHRTKESALRQAKEISMVAKTYY